MSGVDNLAELSAAEILAAHYKGGGRWLTVAAVARRWNVNKSTIYRAVSEGRLQFLRVGGQNGLRISSFWLEHFERRNVNRID